MARQTKPQTVGRKNLNVQPEMEESPKKKRAGKVRRRGIAASPAKRATRATRKIPRRTKKAGGARKRAG
jgi:hypothetical protein